MHIYQLEATGSIAKIFSQSLAVFVKHLAEPAVSQVKVGEF